MARPIYRHLVAKAFFAALCCAGPNVVHASAAEPFGTWITEDGRARVRTERCGAKLDHLCGYVVWMPKPRDDKGQPLLDVENPDAKKHARAILGHQVMLGLALDDDGRFTGKIYNADNGKSYDVHVWSDDAAELSVKGCMLTYLCSTQAWKRVVDVKPGQLSAVTDATGGPRADREWAHAGPGGTGATGTKPPSSGSPE